MFSICVLDAWQRDRRRCTPRVIHEVVSPVHRPALDRRGDHRACTADGTLEGQELEQLLAHGEELDRVCHNVGCRDRHDERRAIVNRLQRDGQLNGGNVGQRNDFFQTSRDEAHVVVGEL